MLNIMEFKSLGVQNEFYYSVISFLKITEAKLLTKLKDEVFERLG